MNVKELTKKLKSKICVFMMVTMVFTNTGVVSFAAEEYAQNEESLQTWESTQQEFYVGEEQPEKADTAETQLEQTEDTTEERVTEMSKNVLMEKDSAWESVAETAEEIPVEEEIQESEIMENAETPMVEMATEGMSEEKTSLTEDAFSTKTISMGAVATETEKVEETGEETVDTVMIEMEEISQNNKAVYLDSGTYGNITWSVDTNGRLLVEGTGDFAPITDDEGRTAPWYGVTDDNGYNPIKTAVIKVTGMTDASNMFERCENLTSLDLREFDTSNIKNMKNMFWFCENLKKIDLSGFDTHNVTDMRGMFVGCKKLTSLNLSSFDTSNVTDMRDMFWECEKLTNLDVSSFDTSNVEDMSGMFEGCRKLTSLDVSSFNTSNVTNMGYMFEVCEKLTNLDVSGFDTSNVTNMGYMFLGCEKLTSLDVSGFNTSNVTDMKDMFAVCEKLTSLDVSGFNTSNVTDMSCMFEGCEKLTSLDVSSFDTSNVTDMSDMFSWCTNLTRLDLSSFDASNVKDIKMLYTVRGDKTGDYSFPAGLYQIYTPYNVPESLSVKSALIGSWYDLEGNLYEDEIPKGRKESVLLQLGERPMVTEHITVAKRKKVYNIGEIINIDDLQVTYYGSDGTVQKPNAAEYTTNVSQLDTSIEGEQTLTVTYKNLKAEIKLIIDKDDSYYQDKERIDLKSVNCTIADIKTMVYNGGAYKPVVKVTAIVNGKKTTLTEGADYHVFYKNNIDAGAGIVTVKGNGAYKGSIEKFFTIECKSIKKVKLFTGSWTTTREKLENLDRVDLSVFPVHIYDGARRLEQGIDYLLYKDKVTKKGTITELQLKVVGIGNYKEEVKNAKITIYEAGTQIIQPADITLDKTSISYTGKAIKENDIKVTVTVNGSVLNPKSDYKVQYRNNKNAGTAFVIVTGKKAYKGTVIVPFKITAETLQKDDVFEINPIKDVTFSGKPQKPAVSVTIQKNGNAKKLSKKDYTVAYKNNFHAGEATITVNGIGNYAGLTATATFTINPQQIKKASLNGTQGNLTLTYSKRKLKEGTDYEKPIYDMVNKNKVLVTIKGKGDFMGDITKTVKTQ